MRNKLFASLSIILTLGIYQHAQASIITLNLSGSVNWMSEYLSEDYGAFQQVPINDEQLTSFFSGVSSFIGSITYDTNLPNISPWPEASWYSPANLSFSIPEIGLSGSGESTVVVANDLNQNLIPDQVNSFVYSVNQFNTEAVGGRSPMNFWFGLYGNSTMLDNNSLPTTSFTPTNGDLSFTFSENQSDRRQLLLSLTDINITTSSISPVPEPNILLLMGTGLTILIAIHRRKNWQSKRPSPEVSPQSCSAG